MRKSIGKAKKKKSKEAMALGKRGGQAVLKKKGKKHFSEMGKLSAARRAKKL